MTRSLLIAFVLVAGCTGDSSSTDELRGPIGKADLVGSCEGDCGGPSSDGNCYCDDECLSFGDCCADKADLCEAPEQACGGLLGLACDAGEYCHYELDAICGAADQTGVCLPTPEACIEVFMPVCGCDDQTYGNACVAHSAGVSVAAEGECPSSNLCGVRGTPPCGEGQFCDFELEAQCGAADHPGTCAPTPEFCPEIFHEVCGCDGITYGNDCFANAAGASVAHDGACEQPEPQFCGGFANLECPDGLTCVDDPDDGCDPAGGGADCGGICVE